MSGLCVEVITTTTPLTTTKSITTRKKLPLKATIIKKTASTRGRPTNNKLSNTGNQSYRNYNDLDDR